MHTLRKRLFFSSFASLVLLATAFVVPAQARIGESEGADLVFGGTGTAPGEFTNLSDITFDPAGNLYTLEAAGPAKDLKHTYVGVGRIQKFDGNGKFLSQFPLGPGVETDGKSDPARLAVDKEGRCYATFPKLEMVREYAPDGTVLRDTKMPGVIAVAIDYAGGKERVAALGGTPQIVHGHWAPVGGDAIWLLDPEGGTPQVVPLPLQMEQVSDLTVDKAGHFYAVAGGTNQIFIFDQSGKLLKTIGAGTHSRAEDGSEPVHCVAVDSKNNIYSLSIGNPGSIVEYTADGKNVLLRYGQFKWADTWNATDNYLPMDVAPDGRIWVASVNLVTHPLYDRFHFRPAVIRTVPNFLTAGVHNVREISALGLGLTPTLKCPLPSNVTFDLKPISTDLTFGAANRNIHQVDVTYHVYDLNKTDVGHGTLSAPLVDGKEATTTLTFTPPRYGWYSLEVRLSAQGQDLRAITQQYGVTPQFPGMTVTPAEFGNGWDDIPRQMFCGLTNVRLFPGRGGDAFQKILDQAHKYNADFFCQLTDQKADFTVEKQQPIIEKYKGQVPYYELFNEPNFSFSPADYVKMALPIYQMIKKVDPAAKVLGPAVCGVNLDWYEQFYKAGGKDTCDILSVHDYEGHETISPQHWRWKFGALRQLMAKYGDANKPVWQTERAISSVRGGIFTGGAQAVRTALQRNLLVTLGIPPEHNNHYYLNQGGYSSVPSYIWSGQGPYPAVLALRTRYALTLGKKYQGTINFGATGNSLLLGLRYSGATGETLVIQNLGTNSVPLMGRLQGGGTVAVVDSFGNQTSLTPKKGEVTLDVGQLPLYVQLTRQQKLGIVPWDFGRNISDSATINYTGNSSGDLSWLQNGILETYNAGNPNGDTDGKRIWQGDVLSPKAPQSLDLTWTAPRTFNKVILRGVHADNGFCALLDYDLQIWQDGAWKPLAKVRSSLPPSDWGESADAIAQSWLLDDNMWYNQFPPVTTTKLRIVFLRVTSGFAPDDLAAAAVVKTWGGVNPPRPMLTEVEVYAPNYPVQITASLPAKEYSAAFAQQPVTVVASNDGPKALTAKLTAIAPKDWTLAPASVAVDLPAHGKKSFQFIANAPQSLDIGHTALNFVLSDAKGVIDTQAAVVKVTAPLTLEPQALPAAVGNAQVFKVNVKNTSEAALSGRMHLSLQGLIVAGGTVPTAPDQDFGPIDPGATAQVSFSVPGFDPNGQQWTARYEATANHLTTSAEQNLSLRTWAVVGAFDSDSEKPPGPEAQLPTPPNLTASYTDMMGGQHKWQQVLGDKEGKVSLKGLFGKDTAGSAYAAIWVNSPQAQPALLSAAFDNSGKIWLNGQSVAAKQISHNFLPGQIQTAVSLKAGLNCILLKIDLNEKDQAFLFDLQNPQTHTSLKDLSWSPHP